MGCVMNEILHEQTILGATPLNVEALDGLLPKHITTCKELYNAEFRNIAETIKKYFTSKRSFVFTVAMAYRLHKEMFVHVWHWAGVKRKIDTNIGVTSMHIDTELKKLFDDFIFWNENNNDSLEISAMLHQRLVQIHPFVNGNGRWARLLANLYLKQKLGRYVLWPEDDLFIASEFRKKYISALQLADKHNYQALIDLHKAYLN